RAEQVKEELARRGRRVERLLDRHDAYVAVAQMLATDEQVLEVATGAIYRKEHDLVERPVAPVAQEPLKVRTLPLRARSHVAIDVRNVPIVRVAQRATAPLLFSEARLVVARLLLRGH